MNVDGSMRMALTTRIDATCVCVCVRVRVCLVYAALATSAWDLKLQVCETLSY